MEYFNTTLDAKANCFPYPHDWEGDLISVVSRKTSWNEYVCFKLALIKSSSRPWERDYKELLFSETIAIFGQFFKYRFTWTTR